MSIDAMWSTLARVGRPFSSFKRGDTIRSSTSSYSYVLTATPGDVSSVPEFRPDLTPGEMLMLGVFEGKYLNDCIAEFPAEWFIGALVHNKLSPSGANPEQCNLFGIKSRQSLSVWQENGWVPSNKSKRTMRAHNSILSDSKQNPDERGWFQWYCRFWMGRRIPVLDHVQISRWRSFRRHAGAVRANCGRGTISCRPRERQALLQWAYNPFL